MSVFKTRQELADEYEIDRKTLSSRLKKKGIVLERGKIFPEQLEKIYEVFGNPKVKDEEIPQNSAILHKISNGAEVFLKHEKPKKRR